MKITNAKSELEKNISKEWIATNGIGGYASSTVVGINTRKYHGLLVASLSQPANRHVVVSKLDESVTFEDGNKYEIFTNICENYIGDGFLNQTKFEKDIMPKFTYNVNGVVIEKTICMEHMKNTVIITYKIKNKNQKIKMELAPILNHRNFHATNDSSHIELNQFENESKVIEAKIGQNDTKIRMFIKDAKYTKFNDTMFLNMFYIEEEKRGFYPIENHVVSGVYEVEIEADETKEFAFVCSIEDEDISKIDTKAVVRKEKKRIKDIITNFEKDEEILLDKDIVKDFIVALDNFVIYRKNTDLYSAIAGYHWFLDWGRDTLISFEGLVLVTKRFDVAKKILQTMVKDVEQGLVPNGYSEGDNTPLYNSVDSSLLLFEQVKKYLNYTSDYTFVEEYLYETLVSIIDNYCKGIDLDDNNIYLDTDNLIVSGTKDTQNTWMDAKYAGVAITPRNGKCVEINSLWYNANKIMEELAKKFGDNEVEKRCKMLAKKCKLVFEEKFYNKKRKSLYDVIGDNKIRPNQLFSLSLEYPVIDPKSEIAENIINTVESKLLNSYGLRSLSKMDQGYTDVYEGDDRIRDFSYHQGITWTWLLGLYYNAVVNMKNETKKKKDKELLEQKLEAFVQNTRKTFEKELYERGAYGSIAEIYDSSKPQLPKGAAMQCWSVSEVFRIMLRKIEGNKNENTRNRSRICDSWI